ncbi:hypothetical protein [Pseudofulvibacter geojedonensis]|uniref:Lipoprotein n=1 Tax=Pseudofulvibacter geojedonensis TaxID=1123758 RepID=A0ABW3HYQ2_9FLAO
MSLKSKMFVLLFCTAFISCSLSAQQKSRLSQKACKFVKKRIDLVEKFYNLEEGYSIELMTASKFLGELTNLKSKYVYSCLTEEPESNKDVIIWKKWFEKNKHLLYWDKFSKTVKIRLENFNTIVTN